PASHSCRRMITRPAAPGNPPPGGREPLLQRSHGGTRSPEYREYGAGTRHPPGGRYRVRAEMAADGWNPDQYARFGAERSQPFYDLLDLVREGPAGGGRGPRGGRIVDLGCGTGELTRVLHERLGAAETVGLDSSPAMLARSAAVAGGGLRFEAGDIAA